MRKFLYGASVQGIQEFIFKTNKLKEIVGASELVKQIASEFESTYDVEEILLNAAGNIKVIFTSEKKCKQAVLNFPKRIQENMYGMTISQAVVDFEDTYTQKEIDTLEEKLKIQRNKQTTPMDLSINAMNLNSRTSRPFLVGKEEDIASTQKLEAYDKLENEKYKDLSSISNAKNKLAIIHIDGNNLGQLIPSLTIPLSEFSKNLNKTTLEAYEKARAGRKVRDIILGGDDVTVICDANYALEFTQVYLEEFEILSEKYLPQKLTACAGIAFANEKYPFHYAVSLAESLCSQAKKQSKSTNNTQAPSSLLFHNIEGSNFQTWNKFVEDELTISNEEQTIRLDFGAYYLNAENQVHIKDFINTVLAYRCDGSPISKLRGWLSELYKDNTYAKNLLDRINQVAEEKNNWNCKVMDRNLKIFNKKLAHHTLIIEKDGYMKTPIYDVLQILSATEEV